MANYSINAVTRRVVYTGSAGLGPYAFTFEILAQTDIVAYFNSTLLTLSTDFTVSINANGTGNITIVTGTNVPSTPTASDQITIIGSRDIERTTDFVTAGDFPAASINEQLDSQIIMIQQIAEENRRGMRAPAYDPALVEDGGVVNMTLPAKDVRKGKYLAFNATTGNPEAGASSDDVVTLAEVTDDIATLADIEDGTDATDAIQTVAGISGNVTTVAGISGNVTTVAGVAANVTTVAGISANVTTVAGVSANVTTVAGISADVTTVAADGTDIGTVAGISADVTAVAGVAADVTAVAGVAADVTTVAGISADVTTVATNVTDITNFSDVYIGPAASDPTVRSDSSALQEGDLYFNTTTDIMRVYTGSAWTDLGVTSGSFLQVNNNLSDLASAPTARTNLGLGSIATYAYDALPAGVVVTGSSAGDALRVTQTGAGNALLVEDATNPDSTPFVVDASGQVGVGTASPGSALDVKGTMRLSGSSSGYVGLAPAAAAGSTTYTLPAADGSSGYALTTNGSGTLSWTATGADELARQNLMVLAFRVAITNNLALGNFLDGRYDQFEDQAGVDDTASTGETYSASDDWYTNNPGGSYTEDNDQADDASEQTPGDGASLAQSFQVSTTGSITKVKFEVGSSAGTVNVKIETDSGGVPSGTLVASGAEKNGVVLTANQYNEITLDTPFTPATATTYWIRVYYVSGSTTAIRCLISGSTYANGTAWRATGGVRTYDWNFGVFQLSAITNMVLISETFTAETQPDDMLIGVLLDPVDSVTINTDLVAAVSRDGGTTYTNATLVDEGDFDGNYLLLFDTVDVSGQPAGTSCKWRLTVANNKEMRVKAVGLLWS